LWILDEMVATSILTHQEACTFLQQLQLKKQAFAGSSM
jgi:hypothetical protein